MHAFIMQYSTHKKVMELANAIERDDVILESLEKSPQTTTNVNNRAKRVRELMDS